MIQVRVNLPNGDMVGHTGDLDATIVACESADKAVKVRTVYGSWPKYHVCINNPNILLILCAHIANDHNIIIIIVNCKQAS